LVQPGVFLRAEQRDFKPEDRKTRHQSGGDTMPPQGVIIGVEKAPFWAETARNFVIWAGFAGVSLNVGPSVVTIEQGRGL
jgi:hypothetical protein